MGEDEIFIWVEGEIIGWLEKDTQETDYSLAVVRVDRWKHETTSWQPNSAMLPVCVLRWLGNDYSITKQSVWSLGLNEGPQVGDWIRFATSEKEQKQYARS